MFLLCSICVTRERHISHRSQQPALYDDAEHSRVKHNARQRKSARPSMSASRTRQKRSIVFCDLNKVRCEIESAAEIVHMERNNRLFKSKHMGHRARESCNAGDSSLKYCRIRARQTLSRVICMCDTAGVDVTCRAYNKLVL